MPKSWSKGLTKENNSSVKKRSETMKRNKIDNFCSWRKEMQKHGKWPTYPNISKTADLAELIGVILGDGHIRKFPRTEELSIFSNSNNPGFIKRYAKLVEKVFNKKPALTNHGNKNCTRIRIYQNHISRRIEIPYSPRGKLKFTVPRWILENNDFIVRYLRGLYEAEGALCTHKPTGTYKLFFSNQNTSLLNIVERLLKKLGFHPHRGTFNIQVSKKVEVYEIAKLIQFRKY